MIAVSLFEKQKMVWLQKALTVSTVILGMSMMGTVHPPAGALCLVFIGAHNKGGSDERVRKKNVFPTRWTDGTPDQIRSDQIDHFFYRSRRRFSLIDPFSPRTIFIGAPEKGGSDERLMKDFYNTWTYLFFSFFLTSGGLVKV